MPQASVNGMTINYSDSGGDGLPVLLIHAFPLHGGMWEPQVEALSDRFRFIAVDLKGFGGSDAPDDRSQYSVDSSADELAAVLDEAGVTKAVICGLSMGGYIAFALLRRHRDRVAGLVLADTRAEADPPEGVAKRTSQQELVEKEGIGALSDGLINALLAEPTREKKPDVVQRVRELMDNPAAGYIGALEALKTRPDSTDDLVGISVPTLIIVGENDALTPVDFSRKMHERIGGSRLVVIPEAGHLSNLEAPEAFNGALAEFLAEID